MIRKLAVLLLVPASAWAADVNSLTVTGIAEFTEAYQAWDGNAFKKAAKTFALAPDSFSNQYWRGAANFHRLLFLLGEPDTPDNPRVLYLDGMSRFYGPSLLGGKSQALELLLAAEKLFAAEAGKPADPVEPRWGRSTCLVYIGRTYEALGKPAEAEAYYRKALAVNPRDRLAQVELEKRKK